MHLQQNKKYVKLFLGDKMATYIFKGISDQDQKKLLTQLYTKTLHYSKGSIVLNNVGKTEMMGIVREGSINVIRIDYNGTKTIIDSLGKNEIFYAGTYPSDNNELSIIASEESRVTLFEYSTMMNLKPRYQELQRKMLDNFTQIIIDKLNQNMERIQILTKKTIREKLLAYFQNESKKYHQKTFKLTLSLTDLADYLAIDRSAMMREIKHLKEDRILSLDKKKVTLYV